MGDTNYDLERVRINLKKGDVLNTIIHEELHENKPEMPHAQVYKNADKIEGSMSLPEMAMKLLEAHEKTLIPAKPKTKIVEVEKIISQSIK